MKFIKVKKQAFSTIPAKTLFINPEKIERVIQDDGKEEIRVIMESGDQFELKMDPEEFFSSVVEL